MDAYTLGAIEINGNLVPEIIDHTLNPGIEILMNRAGGSPDVSFLAGKGTQPILSFTTYALKTILDLTGAGPLAISTTVTAYIYKLAHGSSRAAGSSHIVLTINDGMIVPRAISASQDNVGAPEARMSVDVISTYDGSNLPFTYTGSTALPAGSLVAAEKYVMGPLKLSSSMYDLQSSNFDPGIAEYMAGSGGEPYQRFVAMMDRGVSWQGTTLDMSLINTVGVTGSSQTNAIVFFRAKSSNTMAPDADNAGTHISITFPSAYLVGDTISNSQSGPSTFAMKMTAKDDGTNAPVTIDTAANIA